MQASVRESRASFLIYTEYVSSSSPQLIPHRVERSFPSRSRILYNAEKNSRSRTKEINRKMHPRARQRSTHYPPISSESQLHRSIFVCAHARIYMCIYIGLPVDPISCKVTSPPCHFYIYLRARACRRPNAYIDFNRPFVSSYTTHAHFRFTHPKILDSRL